MRINLRLFLLNYIIAKHESYFSHGSRLVFVHARGAEAVARRVADRMNPRKVSPKEEASVLKGGRHSDRRTPAAWTEDQIDDIRIFGATRARDIFPAHRERETVLKVRLSSIAPPVVDAPFTTPIFALVGMSVYWKYGVMIQGPFVNV